MKSALEEAHLFVPGRLCLFGEHSDWAAEYGLHRGHCLVIGTDQGLSAVAKPSDDFVVNTPVPNDHGGPIDRWRQMRCSWDIQTLLDAACDRDEFFRYCAGVAHEMKSKFDLHGSINLHITSMDLPLKKGVSSSAAACILVAEAFDRVYRLGLFPHELMSLAYRGEKLTGSQCGCMDQACIYGSMPVLLSFERNLEARIEPVFPECRIDMFFVDLAGKKDTVRILGTLQNAYPDSPLLQQAFGKENERIVRGAFRALRDGQAQRIGELMTQAQGLFDELVAPVCIDELASPLLHRLLTWPNIAPHIYGGKGVGSQGDGTAQFVAKSAADREQAMAKIERAMPQMRCFPLTIQVAAQPRRHDAQLTRRSAQETPTE